MSFPAIDLSAATTRQTRILMLQGPSNLFFCLLGRELQAKGAMVHRIGFCLGDSVYWRRDAGGFTPCTVPKAKYPEWIASFLEMYRPTDIIMLGDGRFYHREAREVACRRSDPPRIHIVEHGLIRPGWLLVEPDGMGRRSRISERFRTTPPRIVPHAVPAPGGSFLRYAAFDIGYHVPGMLFGWLYNRNYERPNIVSQWVEYGSWIRKFFSRFKSGRSDRATMTALEQVPGPLFLFPLQLEADFQIRDHGNGRALSEHLEDVLKSFAAFAPSDAHVLIKRHPLDNGRAPWRKQVHRLVQDIGLNGRVHYLDGGDVDTLLKRAAGVVTVNSTVGLQAVLAGCPCAVLGTAVYNIEGLTATTGLDRFWTSPERPHRTTAEKFRAFLLADYHIPGSFDGPGASVGAKALAERLVS